MNELDEVRSLIEYTIRGIVDRPEDVKVIAVPQDGAILYRVAVAPEDFGSAIGRRGDTVRSMRILLSAVAAKLHQEISLDIVE
jgi:predicted RNA-binding protein YlqC (UPF0109 family)